MKVLCVPFYPRNPYQSLLATALEEHGVEVRGVPAVGIDRPTFMKELRAWNPDVLHLHWLHPYFRAERWWQACWYGREFLSHLREVRKRRIRIVWTAHNLRNHEGLHPIFDRFVTTRVSRYADAIIAHGESARDDIVRHCGRRIHHRIQVVPIGNYINAYPNEVARDNARAALEIADGTFVFLFLGRLRSYKGTRDMLRSFRDAELPDDSLLLIAGKSSTELGRKRMKRRCRNVPGVRLDYGHVLDDRIQNYMNAADVVVVPYDRSILSSSAVTLAMSFGRPIIAPDIGAIRDATDERGAFLYDLAVKNGLKRAFEQAVAATARREQMGSVNFERSSEWPWSRVAARTHELYRGSNENA